ncbi:hypothetical protein QYS48_28805 [Marivirga arenosa]|uniref:Uncharacterized protein n=1 Tax=Marivirga arenosa TaxID=3059076 RepID=A0AA51NAE6_9BACT|nr:hypothetical protein [Marivirga sp. ABR2-2]WMN07456.1 hypothetical protein QYS48_28805 [Marivirga sp. ABR2-2]
MQIKSYYIILLSIILFSCSEDGLLPSRNKNSTIYLIKKNSIDRIDLNEAIINDNYYSFTLNAEKATKNENYIVLASSSNANYDEEITIIDLENGSKFTLDITQELNYEYNIHTFWLNDVYIKNDKVYVLGIKVDYSDVVDDSLQLIEVDLKSKVITKSALINHENTAANKYIKYVTDEGLYFNITDELLYFDLKSFNQLNSTSIKTSFFPNNIIIDNDNTLNYYDIGLKNYFKLSNQGFTVDSKNTLDNLDLSPLTREYPVARLGNTFIGLYLTNTYPQVGIYQYDFKQLKTIKMIQEDELNNIFTDTGYKVIHSDMIKVVDRNIVYFGQIFNEEKSELEYIITILDSDFKIIDSFTFDPDSGIPISIL